MISNQCTKAFIAFLSDIAVEAIQIYAKRCQGQLDCLAYATTSLPRFALLCDYETVFSNQADSSARFIERDSPIEEVDAIILIFYT